MTTWPAPNPKKRGGDMTGPMLQVHLLNIVPPSNQPTTNPQHPSAWRRASLVIPE